MFRLIGFLGGTIMFLVLAVKEIKGYHYYYICSLTSISILVFVITFRIIAKYLNGFWKVWSRRLQRWNSNAIICLNKWIHMPDYQSTVHPSSSDQRSSLKTIQVTPNFWWGLLETLISFLLTAVAPLLLFFVLFCYGEAFYEQYVHKRARQSYKQKREEQVARQSARMSLEAPLNKSIQNENIRHSTLRAATYIPAVIESTSEQKEEKPAIEIKLLQKVQEISENKEEEAEASVKSSKQSLPPEETTFNQSNHQSNPTHDQQQQFKQRIVRGPSNIPRNLLPYSISKITQQSKSYAQSIQYQNLELRASQAPRQSVINISYPIQDEEQQQSKQRRSLPKYELTVNRMSKDKRDRMKSVQNDQL